MNSVFVTGSNGFVGTALCQELLKRKIPFRAGVRKAENATEVSYGEITEQNNWELLLKDVDVVVHLAARVHIMNDLASDPLAEFMKSNCEATLKIATAARKVGVRRFIFISSVKVNGEETFENPFRPSDKPQASDPYGISKLEAEKALLAIHEAGVFEVVIIRPPLIYGPQVKANFRSLFRLVSKRLPLPFGLVDNRRSLVSVWNLVDLIIHCFNQPNAGGRVFLASDDQDLSLKSLILKMASVLKVRALLIPIPVSLMKIGAALLGKKSYADRLFGNLQVDISETKQLLNWKPPYTFEQSFADRSQQESPLASK